MVTILNFNKCKGYFYFLIQTGTLYGAAIKEAISINWKIFMLVIFLTVQSADELPDTWVRVDS